MVGKFGYVKQVARNSRHKLSDLCFRKIAERELFNVLKQRRAHIGFNSCAHNVTDIRHKILRRYVNYPQNKIQRGDF